MSAGTRNITIDQGSDFQYPMQLFESDGVTPIDLTGYTIRGMIRQNYNDTSPIIEFTGTLVDGPLGKVNLELNNIQTASLLFTRAMYDAETVSPTGVVTRIIQGFVRLSKEVTK